MPKENCIWLPSKGLNERVTTPHRYERSEVVTLIPKKGNPVTGLAHYFTCTVTLVERRYGFDRTGFEKKTEEDDDVN